MAKTYGNPQARGGRIMEMLTSRWMAVFFIALLAHAATAEKKLSLVQANVEQMEDGPPAPSNYRFIPGEAVYFSLQVSGYKKSPEDKIDLEYEIQAQDPKGLLLVPARTGSVNATVSPEDKDWMPKVRYTFNVPPYAESSDYTISAKLKDRIGDDTASVTTPFHVEGHAVAPSDKLVIRNFHFLRTEEDKDPLTIAAYRPGDTVWARFDITCYNVGPGNSFDVEYSVSVLRGDGSVAYSQPHAAEEKRGAFYPQRYTPGVASLKAPPDIRKGEYTMVITAQDHIGQQTAEVREKFSIE